MSGARVEMTWGFAVGAAVGCGATVGGKGKVGLMIEMGVTVGRGVDDAGWADPQAASRTIGIARQTDRVSRATKFVIDISCSMK